MADVGLVIVVGSARSSNSCRLVEVVRKAGRQARLSGLDLGRSEGSTPSQLTRRVIQYLESLEPAAGGTWAPRRRPQKPA